METEPPDEHRFRQQLAVRLAVLERQLRVAEKLYIDGLENEPVDNGKVGVVMALKAVTELIDFLGITNGTKPLDALAAALLDAEQGRTNPLTAPIKINHRPKDSIRHAIVKVQAAATMQLLMDAGQTKKDAAGAVARSLRRANFVPQPTASTVIGWRDSYIGNTGGNRDAARYSASLRLLRSVDDTPEGRAQRAVDALSVWIKNENLNNPPS